MKYVTKTGRSIRTGRTTRASLTVKRPTSEKPLPLHLQCHPQALHRTPTHPDCRDYEQPTGALMALSPFSALLMRRGHGLSTTKTNVSVAVDGCGTWYAKDSAHGLEWAKAARAHGLIVNVFLNY